MPQTAQSDEASPKINLDAYLDRIGYQGDLSPTVDTLGALHYAHATSIPFENLDILLGESIHLDLESLQNKLVAKRRGGYCFEHNTLFAAVCEKVGYTVERLAARVRSSAAAVRPRTHMLLSVTIDSEPWLADVGFGRVGPLYPMPLNRSEPVTHGAWTLRVTRDAGATRLQSRDGDRWIDLYDFTAEPQHPVDYEVANHYTSTYPGSPFVHNLIAQRATDQMRWSLHNRELTEETGSEKKTETLSDDEALLATLSEVFGLHFPPKTHFRYGT
jgi:N-hydroxyarylamine O-acetyltransferase